jgi:hypothetical protein
MRLSRLSTCLTPKITIKPTDLFALLNITCYYCQVDIATTSSYWEICIFKVMHQIQIKQSSIQLIKSIYI